MNQTRTECPFRTQRIHGTGPSRSRHDVRRFVWWMATLEIAAQYSFDRSGLARPRATLIDGLLRRVQCIGTWVLVAVASVVLSGTSSRAQSSLFQDLEYRASEGIVPPSPCWESSSTGAGGTAQIANQLLTVSAPSGGGYGIVAHRPSFRWADGRTIEARVRVPQGGTSALPGFRAAAYFGGTDVDGRTIFVWIWSSGVGISTDANASPGPGLITIDFDAATRFHTYTVVSNEVGIALSIDGVPRLTLPYTNTNPSSSRFEFGSDARTTGSSTTEWQYVRTASTPSSPCGNGLDLTYRASDAALPQSPCWAADGAGGTAQVTGNLLIANSSGGVLGYTASRPPFRWADGHTMEARLRVPVGGTTSLPGLRAAAYIGGCDENGLFNYIWVWSTGVALSTDQNASAGPGLVTMAFDAASQAHTYTLVSSATGVVLLIDGVQRLSLPYTSASQFRNLFQFGSDTRTTGAATVEWEYVRLGSALSPSSVVSCASGPASLSVALVGPGPFVYQWRKNGVPIDATSNPSAATATLSLPALTNADVASYDCVVTDASGACGSVTTNPVTLTVRGAKCNPADIAADNGAPLPPIGPCETNLVNNGVTEGDYNLFFATFFDAGPACDIADDQGTPLPPFGNGGIAPAVNNGVTEGDYNLFFSIFFDGCAF